MISIVAVCDHSPLLPPPPPPPPSQQQPEQQWSEIATSSCVVSTITKLARVVSSVSTGEYRGVDCITRTREAATEVTLFALVFYCRDLTNNAFSFLAPSSLLGLNNLTTL